MGRNYLSGHIKVKSLTDARYKACLELGIEPKIQVWDGQGSLVAFVTALNLERRHLNPGQINVIGMKIKHIFEEEAKKRQEEGRIQGGYARHNSSPANLQTSININTTPIEQAEQAAKLVGGSTRGIYLAQKVAREGGPEIIGAVETGEITLNKAEKIVKLPKEQQLPALKEAISPKQKQDPEPPKSQKELNEEYLAANPDVIENEHRKEIMELVDRMAGTTGKDVAEIEMIIAQDPEFLNVEDLLGGYAWFLIKAGNKINDYIQFKKKRIAKEEKKNASLGKLVFQNRF